MNTKPIFRIMRANEFAMAYRMCRNRYCTDVYTLEKKKIIHPYHKIHPWKSQNEFANSLLKNVIYNADGIVAINKPYGISTLNIQHENPNKNITSIHNVVGGVNYTIDNVLPYMAKELDVPILIPCTGLEKYTSGVYIFGINNEVCTQIIKALRRASHLGEFRKYWAVTIRVPKDIKGSYRLGMTLKKSSNEDKKAIIITAWSKNAVKRNEVQILNIKYKILSNSTHNLSSLIEIQTSTRRWHAIRLFVSTMLYSPILGDNYYGSRVQEIMGTLMKIDPFAESVMNLPRLNPDLLKLLSITQGQQDIIPVHLHLKSIYLKSFGQKQKDILIEAPLTDHFDWTCKQLMFKSTSLKQDDHKNIEVLI